MKKQKKNTKNKKKTIIIVLVVLLVLISGVSIYFGIYFTKLTKPNRIVGLSINKLDNRISSYIGMSNEYNLGDTFHVDSTLTFDLDSEDYLNKSKTDKEYQDKYKMIKNLSKTTNNISVIQDRKHKKLLLSVDSELDKEKLLNAKYLIDNSTGYYFVEDILKDYVNEGTNNYFEMFDDESNTISNKEYLHRAFIKALQLSLKEEYFNKYKANVNVGNSNVQANQISIRIDDKMLHSIINDTLDNLRNDTTANRILTSIDEDFSKYKVKSKKTLLAKKEVYTLNVYTSKYLNKVLKYEVVHLKGDEKKTYIYEGNVEKGRFYYIEDDTVIYSVDVNATTNLLECKIKDNSNKNIGAIKVEKYPDSGYYTFNFDDGKKKYDIIYSSKYSDYKKNKSFTNEKKLSFKYLNNKVSVLSGEVILTSKASKTAKIAEEVDKSVLYSTLSDEEKNKFDTRIDKLEERLKK